MADKNNKVDGSIAGKFYVDSQCIDCNLCIDTAAQNFKHHDSGYAVVCKQPAGADEEAQCMDSKNSCPVEAIGDDGE